MPIGEHARIVGHYDDSSRAAAPDSANPAGRCRGLRAAVRRRHALDRRHAARSGAGVLVTTVGASSGVILTTAALARLRVKKGDTLYLIGGAGRLGAQDTRSV